jgi:hypothetical protein
MLFHIVRAGIEFGSYGIQVEMSENGRKALTTSSEARKT